MLAAVITDIEDIRKAENADLIELRLDYLKNLNYSNLNKIIRNSKKPIIITNRKKSEGGLFDENETKRIEILKNTIKFGADYLDVEYSSDLNSIRELINNKKNTKIIVSYHNFRGTPDNIKNIYNNIKSLNPDIIKIVTNANSVTDNFRLFDIIKTANKEKRKIIAFCMGSYGQFSRILSIILGSQITYASIGKRKESASGQLTIDEMYEFYRISKLNNNTKIVGLIGNPVEHSWSHIIHNTGFNKLNVNAVYLKFQVDKLKEFIDYFKKLNVMGFSVTTPYKIEVMKYLDEIDEKAKIIGAVNTIVVRNKKLVGCNTDCDGAIRALKQKTNLKNKNVVLLGAGGSTRAIAFGLKKEGSNITILNRTIEKARVFANYFNCNYGSLNDLNSIDYDVLINTTSAGMYPNTNSSLVPTKSIKKNSIIFDIVFNPFKTKLLKDAERRNCTTITGFEMLMNGAVLQFKLWTSRDAPKQLMRKKVVGYLKNASH